MLRQLLFLLLFSVVLDHCFGDLKSAIVLWRHGDRNPTYILPNDNLNRPDSWPGGLGELTQAGIKQMYNLGLHFKQEYGKLTNNTYQFDKLRIESGDDNRTLTSASTVLAAMYPPTASQVWNKQLPWQPIPVHINSRLEKIQGDVLAKGEACPNLKYLSETELNKKLKQENEDLWDYMAEVSGYRVNNVLIDISNLVDALLIEKKKGRKWPNWMNETIFQRADGIFAQARGEVYLDPKALSLSGGWLLQRMLMYVNNSRYHLTDHLMIGISGHDDNLKALSYALGFADIDIRKFVYGAYIALEYYANDTVQVWLRTGENDTRISVPLPKCGSQFSCSFNTFHNNYKDIFPIEDWDVECGNVESEAKHNKLRTVIIVLAVLTAIFFLFAVLSCALYCSTKSRYQRMKKDYERRPLMATYGSS